MKETRYAETLKKLKQEPRNVDINNLIKKDTSRIENWYGYPVSRGYYDNYGALVLETGVSFTVHSEGATNIELLLFNGGAAEPFAILPYPKKYKIGDVYSMTVHGLSDLEDLEYCFRVSGNYDPKKGEIFDDTKAVIDPYARKIVHHSGKNQKYPFRAKLQIDYFDWEGVKSPKIPRDEMVIYEMHVRGFTESKTSNVQARGTFQGIIEKIPYLKALGVNTIELLPVFKFDPDLDKREYDGKVLRDYWGYNPVGFYALNDDYTYNDSGIVEGREFKELVKVLHKNGMELILDVVFNHTAEGNDEGDYISFKGFDNQIYYMLTPDGFYYNFSGCGNTFNCNHPVARQMILSCLRYWVTHYHIDGFRFDLASIMGRDKNGEPLSDPPILESMAQDPVLKDVELIAEAWDAGGLYQVGSFAPSNRWSEWNGRYRDSMRKFLKGDPDMIYEASQSMIGSPDLYDQNTRGKNVSVNFITCHDGFTLRDLYTYNDKHNEANGWNNTDGTSYNYSWNLGYEGESEDEGLNKRRKQMTLNACVCLLSSFGIPMISSGDEFYNTQYGNNNVYCQDNEISWLNWDDLKEHKDIFAFWQKMIYFRKKHPILRGSAKENHSGLPRVSFHGEQPFYLDTSYNSHYLGILYAGRDQEDTHDEFIYLAINTHWEDKYIKLPEIDGVDKWYRVIDTSKDSNDNFNFNTLSEDASYNSSIKLAPRSVKLLIAKKN